MNTNTPSSGNSPRALVKHHTGRSITFGFVGALAIFAVLARDAGAADYVYYTNGAGESVFRANPDGSSPVTIFDRSGSGNGITQIKIDTVHNKIYFTDRDNIGGTPASLGLWMGNLDGSGSLTKLANITDNYGLALDVANGKIYESSQNTGEVFRYNLDGSGQTRILSGLNGPTYMDIGAGSLFIGSWTSDAGYKYDIASGDLTRLNFGVNTWGIASDPVDGKVYGASIFNHAIYETDLDGNNLGVFAWGLPYVAYLQNFEGNLYALASGMIYSAPLGSNSFSSVFSPGGPFAYADVGAVPEPATMIIWSALVGIGTAIARWRKRAAYDE